MKKILLSLTLLMLIAGSFTSCNKKKLNELEDELAATKADLEATKNTVNSNNANTNNILQAGSPIRVTVTGNRNYDSAAFSYSSTYDYIDSDNYNENYVEAYSDGTYDFWVEKYATASAGLYAYIWVTGYDPSVGISSASCDVYYENRYAQSDTTANLYLWNEGYKDYYSYTNNMTINSISYNKTTHAFSADFTINTTEGSSYGSTSNPAVSRVTYNGTLTPYSTVYRTGNAPSRRAH